MKRLITIMQILALMAFTNSMVKGRPFSSDSPQETKPPARDAEKLSAVESGYIQVDGGKTFYEAAGQGPVIIKMYSAMGRTRRGISAEKTNFLGNA